MRELLVYLDLEQLFNFLFKKFKYVCQVSFHKAKIFQCLARLEHSVWLYLSFHSWNQLSIGIPKWRLWKTLTHQWVKSYTILTKDLLMVNWKKLLIIDYWYNLHPHACSGHADCACLDFLLGNRMSRILYTIVSVLPPR